MNSILIIEDEKNIRENLSELLTAEEYDVRSAENGKLGIEEISKQKPDLILCDVMMPEMNGYEVAKYLQEHSIYSTIPFIFLTARADLSNIREGMNLGADDYITKPFKIDDVLSAVEKRIEKKIKNEKKIFDLRENLSLSLPHELRTPLMSILGFSQILNSEARTLTPNEIEEMSSSIIKAGNRLLRLIENYLFYSELLMLKKEVRDASELVSELTYNPNELILSTLSRLQKKYPNNQIKHDLAPNVILKFDSQYFIKIIEELVDNACKFSFTNAEIQISTKIEGDYHILTINNSGPGMTSEEINALGAFMQFNRKQLEQQGSGLGLIISKELMELFNGKLKIESQKNSSTEVVLTFPISHN